MELPRDTKAQSQDVYQGPWGGSKRSSSKVAASFTRGMYWKYGSAHGPKVAKPVSPKAKKTGESAAAGGFFQWTHFGSYRQKEQ